VSTSTQRRSAVDSVARHVLRYVPCIGGSHARTPRHPSQPDRLRCFGHVQADTLILEAQFAFAPDTTMPAAAEATVAAALGLYGSGVADGVRKAFVERGILE
jgi:hypothetical protein